MTVVPSGAPISVISSGVTSGADVPSDKPGTTSLTARMPTREFLVLVIISTLETAAMEERASPRKPRLCSLVRSSASLILLVA